MENILKSSTKIRDIDRIIGFVAAFGSILGALSILPPMIGNLSSNIILTLFFLLNLCGIYASNNVKPGIMITVFLIMFFPFFRILFHLNLDI